MAQQLDDCAHLWGEDLQLSPTGDLARASGDDRSKQRVLRRLLTNPGDYSSHTTYGAGLPGYVGSDAQAPELETLIVGQMRLEASVARTPTPSITATPIANGVSVAGSYTTAPERQPVALAFSVSA